MGTLQLPSESVVELFLPQFPQGVNTEEVVVAACTALVQDFMLPGSSHPLCSLIFHPVVREKPGKTYVICHKIEAQKKSALPKAT